MTIFKKKNFYLKGIFLFFGIFMALWNARILDIPCGFHHGNPSFFGSGMVPYHDYAKCLLKFIWDLMVGPGLHGEKKYFILKLEIGPRKTMQ